MRVSAALRAHFGEPFLFLAHFWPKYSPNLATYSVAATTGACETSCCDSTGLGGTILAGAGGRLGSSGFFNAGGDMKLTNSVFTSDGLGSI